MAKDKLHEVEVETGVAMKMRDGVELMADVYTPKEGGEYPVLLLRLPYDKSVAEVQALMHPEWYARHGYIVVKNPLAKHSLGVGILNRLKLEFIGSLGYFGCGLIDGPNVRVHGRVGWSFCENMMAGTAVVEKNAGSTFGAAIRGGDLVCKGDVGKVLGVHAAEEMKLKGPIISIDGIALEEFDYIDIGSIMVASGAVPVVIKSLLFPGSGGSE